MKTRVYIDGFNLYYGFLKNKKGVKWLNIQQLIVDTLPKEGYELDKIKFFTARVKDTEYDLQKTARQLAYLRALKTLQKVEIIEGNFIKKKVNININRDVKITALIPEEKGTDVNLAVHLVNDGHLNLYDVAVIVSNDSDLSEALRVVKNDLRKETWLINPCEGRNHTEKLKMYADNLRKVREKNVRNSQFPNNFRDENGEITKPQSW